MSFLLWHRGRRNTVLLSLVNGVVHVVSRDDFSSLCSLLHSIHNRRLWHLRSCSVVADARGQVDDEEDVELEEHRDGHEDGVDHQGHGAQSPGQDESEAKTRNG